MTSAPHIRFDNSYARLPAQFYARVAPVPVAAPQLIKINDDLARSLGIDPVWLASPHGIAVLSGNVVADGSEPLAMAYAGHQFGNYSPQLGDGRANLLGEVIGNDGRRFDIQLKGSGPTPFSRRGDGRAALGPVLREYILSEAFAALGIPTTRALAAVTSGEDVWRETPLPGAILTRVAASHIRVGTFQFFAARGDTASVRLLADHVIARHYPDAALEENPYRALLDAIIVRQTALVAQWMHVGFIHGVMNTDNMSIAGETIDFGPCAFMDRYDPATVYSAIDEMGRYAYGNQPRIAQWNLARLVEALLPLLGDSEEAAMKQAQGAIDGFTPHFLAAYTAGFRRKLGLFTAGNDDLALGQDLLTRMATGGADFTLTFRHLCDAAANTETSGPETSGPEARDAVRAQFADPTLFDDWAITWRERLAQEASDPALRVGYMRAANPMFIPRNHLVEEAIAAAVQRRDLAPFEQLLKVLAHPYDDQPDFARYAQPPAPDQVVRQTFCGT
jgi:serine/tyrosine/threonine adenylyltransferase